MIQAKEADPHRLHAFNKASKTMIEKSKTNLEKKKKESMTQGKTPTQDITEVMTRKVTCDYLHPHSRWRQVGTNN